MKKINEYLSVQFGQHKTGSVVNLNINGVEQGEPFSITTDQDGFRHVTVRLKPASALMLAAALKDYAERMSVPDELVLPVN